MNIVSVCAVIFSVFSGCHCAERLVFPPDFMFGASTSSFQVEGAWDIGGKSESVGDRFVHTNPDKIAGGGSSDVACDSYHQWRRDIEMAEELGLNMYRFSISWPRILPSGFPNYVNMEGVKYYSDLIDGLLEKGIQPLVTIFHYELPQSLQDLGGWANPLMADWFADYARVVYSLYADRVKLWLTINEPIALCDGGFGEQLPPSLDDRKIGLFLCNKYALLAHAKAWRIYDEEFKPKYHGKVSIGTLFLWFKPATPDDVEATELTIDYWESRYNHPIYSKQGGWLPKIEKILNENARSEGYPQPRLPPFTPEQVKLVKGTYDYYGLNHYTTRLVRKARPGEEAGRFLFEGFDEIRTVMEHHPDWPLSDIPWFQTYPEGLRQQLHWLNTTYGPMEILIAEGGYASNSDGLDDEPRLEYIKGYLGQLLLAISDGIPVLGYSVWSLMDTFEWMAGYTIHFGLYAVDYSSPLRTRTPRDSARYYAAVTRSRAVHSTHDALNYV